MNFIYSYWETADDNQNLLESFSNRWLNTEFMFFSLIQSVLKSKEYATKVVMITTTRCKPIFDKLEIFDEVTTDLDAISHYDRDMWALGKIYAYSIQTEPFIHIDNDVHFNYKFPIYLFNESKIDIAVQSIEHNKSSMTTFTPFYNRIINTLYKNGFKTNILNFGRSFKAYNMGIYLCNNIEFNTLYCTEVFKMINENKEAFIKAKKICVSVIFEQYLLYLLAEREGLRVEVLIDNYKDKFIQEYGYLHIWGRKKDLELYNKFKNLFINYYPNYLEKINNLLDIYNIKQELKNK